MDGLNEDFTEDIPVFAKRIKSRFPQYNDIEDSELVGRIVRKHPVYASKVKLPDNFRLLQTSSGYKVLDDLYEQFGREEGIDPNLLLEQGRQESINFKQSVVYGRLDSPKGARGVAQFMPDTARRYGLKVGNGIDERTDPIKSIRAQAKYMRDLLEMFDDDESLALAGYNAGENRRSLRNGQIPNIKETRDYVNIISGKLRSARGSSSGIISNNSQIKTSSDRKVFVNPELLPKVSLSELPPQSLGNSAVVPELETGDQKLPPIPTQTENPLTTAPPRPLPEVSRPTIPAIDDVFNQPPNQISPTQKIAEASETQNDFIAPSASKVLQPPNAATANLPPIPDEYKTDYGEFLKYSNLSDGEAARRSYVQSVLKPLAETERKQAAQFESDSQNYEQQIAQSPPQAVEQPLPESVEVPKDETNQKVVKTDADILETIAGSVEVDLSKKPVGMPLQEYLFRSAIKTVGKKYNLTDAQRQAAENAIRADAGKLLVNPYDDITDENFGEFLNEYKSAYGKSSMTINLTRNAINAALTSKSGGTISDTVRKDFEREQAERNINLYTSDQSLGKNKFGDEVRPRDYQADFERQTAAEEAAYNKTRSEKENDSGWGVEKFLNKRIDNAKNFLIHPLYGIYKEISGDITDTRSEEERTQAELGKIRREYGSFREYQKEQDYYAQMSAPEFASRMLAETGRGVVKTAVSGVFKGVDFLDTINEQYNPLMRLIPEDSRPTLRNIGNALAYTIAYAQGKKVTLAKASDDVDKRLFYNIGKVIDESLGDDKYLKERFAGKLAQGAGSGVGFVLMGLVAPTASISTRLGTYGVTSGILGGVTSAGTSYATAKEQGLSENQAQLNGVIGGILGTTEGFGIGAALNKAFTNPAARKRFISSYLNFLEDKGRAFVRGGAEESVQEFVQSTGGKATLEAIKDDDPNAFNRIMNIIERLPKQAAKTLTDEVPMALLSGGVLDTLARAAVGNGRETVAKENAPADAEIVLDPENNLYKQFDDYFADGKKTNTKTTPGETLTETVAPRPAQNEIISKPKISETVADDLAPNERKVLEAFRSPDERLTYEDIESRTGLSMPEQQKAQFDLAEKGFLRNEGNIDDGSFRYVAEKNVFENSAEPIGETQPHVKLQKTESKSPRGLLPPMPEKSAVAETPEQLDRIQKLQGRLDKSGGKIVSVKLTNAGNLHVEWMQKGDKSPRQATVFKTGEIQPSFVGRANYVKDLIGKTEKVSSLEKPEAVGGKVGETLSDIKQKTQRNVETELSRRIVNAYRSLYDKPEYKGELSGLRDALTDANDSHADIVFRLLKKPDEAVNYIRALELNKDFFGPKAETKTALQKNLFDEQNIQGEAETSGGLMQGENFAEQMRRDYVRAQKEEGITEDFTDYAIRQRVEKDAFPFSKSENLPSRNSSNISETSAPVYPKQTTTRELDAKRLSVLDQKRAASIDAEYEAVAGQSPKELIGKAVVKYKDGNLYTNAEATELLRHADYVAFKDAESFNYYGRYLNPGNAERVLNALKMNFSVARYIGEANKAKQQRIIREFEKAIRESKNADIRQIVTSKEAIYGMKAARQEETAHGADYAVGLKHRIGEAIFKNDKIGRRAIRHVRENGYSNYSDETLGREVSAKIFLDTATEDLNLSPDKIKYLRRLYFDALKSAKVKPSEIKEVFSTVSKSTRNYLKENYANDTIGNDRGRTGETRLGTRRTKGTVGEAVAGRTGNISQGISGIREGTGGRSKLNDLELYERKFIESKTGDKAEAEAVASEVLYSKPSKTDKMTLGDYVLDVSVGIPKALKATLDWSAPGRQGWIVTLSNPVAAAKSFVRQGKSFFSAESHKRFIESLENHPLGRVMEKSGLYLNGLANRKDLNQREEQFMSRILGEDKFFNNKDAETARRVGTIPIRASERAFAGYLDNIRVESFVHLSRLVHDYNQRHGIRNAAQIQKQLDGVAKFVNFATGRGSLGKFEDHAAMLNLPFFSARNWMSRFQILNPVMYAKLPAGARSAVLHEFGRFVGASSLAFLLLGASGIADIETNPESPDFLKVRIGQYRYDISGSLVQQLRYISQMVKGAVAGDPQKMAETSLRYIRGKLSPTFGAIVSTATGTQISGKPTSAGKEAVGLVTPIFLETILDAADKDGSLGALLAMPDFLGFSVSRYDSSLEVGKSLAEMERELAKLPVGSDEAKRLGAAVKLWRDYYYRTKKQTGELPPGMRRTPEEEEQKEKYAERDAAVEYIGEENEPPVKKYDLREKIDFYKTNKDKLFSFAKDELESLIIQNAESLRVRGKLSDALLQQVKEIIPDYEPLRENQPGVDLRPEKLKKLPKREKLPKRPKLPPIPQR